MALATNSNTAVLTSYFLKSGVYRLLTTAIDNVAISATQNEVATKRRSDKLLTQAVAFPIVRFIILRIKNTYPIEVSINDHTNGLKHDIIMVSKLSLVAFNTAEEKNMVYGYWRVSTKHQRITRQVTNIKELSVMCYFV